MMLYNNNSDHGYGSGSSSSSWLSQQDVRWPPLPPQPLDRPTQAKSSSYSNLVTGRCSLEDVMRDFHMNGSDAPYEPDDDGWGKRAASDVLLSGMGPHSAFLRQRSWPAPERSPAPPLPPAPLATSTPLSDEAASFIPLPLPPQHACPPAPPALSAEQARVLASLPPALISSLLRQLQHEKRTRTFQECRFCKNNGERESFYRGHVLKDAAGRVACPVLRAFRCQRCGASGDRAHTIKYCPLSTNDERILSANMMRSVRLSSGRRRAQPAAAAAPARYVSFGQPSASALGDSGALAEPLDPLWAALEQKLLL